MGDHNLNDHACTYILLVCSGGNVCKTIILLVLSLSILYLHLYNTITKLKITPTTKGNPLIFQPDLSRQLCLYYTLRTDPKATMFQLVIHLALTISKRQLESHVSD